MNGSTSSTNPECFGTCSEMERLRAELDCERERARVLDGAMLWLGTVGGVPVSVVTRAILYGMKCAEETES